MLSVSPRLPWSDRKLLIDIQFHPFSDCLMMIDTLAEKGGDSMGLDSAVKKNWIEIQKKHDVPINAIGVKIDPKDKKTLKVWKEEGIDQFMKR